MQRSIYLSGLIDTHTHGISGYDFNNMEGLSLSEIAKSEAEEGVTGFLASLVCETHEDMKQLLTYYENKKWMVFSVFT